MLKLSGNYKVKDLLEDIEKLRQSNPDIDNYCIVTSTGHANYNNIYSIEEISVIDIKQKMILIDCTTK